MSPAAAERDLGPVEWNASPDIDFDTANTAPPETAFVLENLTDDECALVAILQDHSGLDLAEFTWVEERNKPHYCWRAWPFQWSWWRCMDQKQIDLAGRALGKSESIKARCCVFPFAHPGGEMVLTAPEGIHVEAITERIETQFTGTRFMREMLFKGRNGITHRPFKVRFLNGARIMSRIPQRSGTGVKGCFPAGTLVLTRRGLRPIEDVETGDVVFTHRRRWRPVTATHHYTDRLARVSIDGHPDLVLTPSHPLWAKAFDDEDELNVNPTWIRVDDMKDFAGKGGIYVSIPASFPVSTSRPTSELGAAIEAGRRAAMKGKIPVAIFDRPRPVRVKFVEGLESVGVEGSAAFAISAQILSAQLARPSRLVQVKETFRSRLARVARRLPAPAEVWRTEFGCGSEEFDSGLVFAKVTKIRRLRGQHEVFDLTVADDHSYIANGIVSSNTHPVWLEMDEGQDYPHKGWTEITETLQRDTEGSQWRVHGVTRGIPDDFYDATQPGSGWKVHFPITSMHKPTWTEGEREDKIQEYGGSKDDPDYRRNVLGVHGDATSAIFLLNKLMRCVDQRVASDYNESEYSYQELRHESVEDRARAEGVGIEEHGRVACSLIDLPEMHRQKYKSFWGGMDVGITKDPSEILIFAEYVPSAAERREHMTAKIALPPDGQTRLKLLFRLKLVRMDYPVQTAILLKIIEHYRPQAFALDKTGNGLAILQNLQVAAATSRIITVELDGEEAHLKKKVDDTKKALTVIKGYNFGEKIIVEIDEEKAALMPPTATLEEIVKECGIKKNVKEYATDQMRLLVDGQRMLLPMQKDLILQLTGQSESLTNSKVDAYGNRAKTYSEGTYHAFDGARMAVLGMAMNAIEAFIGQKPKKKRPVFDIPVWE